MEPGDPGFHHSVLTDSRDRLAEDGRVGQLPGFALERVKQAGLITGRGKARTGSTYVLAAVRDLTRVELITEAVRAALEELAREDPGIPDELTGRDRATRYGRPVRLGGQPSGPVARLGQVGLDTYLLLTMAERNQRQGGPGSDGLRRIFLQACFAMCGDTRWVRYLIHVTGTCDQDTVDLVTGVAAAACAVKNHEAFAVIGARLARRASLPAGHLADGGYITPGRLHAAAGQQITMAGPPGHDNSWHARGNIGLALVGFAIGSGKRQMRCWPARPAATGRHRASKEGADHRGEVRQAPVRSLPGPGLVHPGERGPDRQLSAPSPA